MPKDLRNHLNIKENEEVIAQKSIEINTLNMAFLRLFSLIMITVNYCTRRDFRELLNPFVFVKLAAQRKKTYKVIGQLKK